MLAEEEGTEDLYLFFAEFEEFCREFERARAIYKYALDHVEKSRADALYARFVTFEKQHGDRESIEEVLSAKKRLQVWPFDGSSRGTTPAGFTGVWAGFYILSRLKSAQRDRMLLVVPGTTCALLAVRRCSGGAAAELRRVVRLHKA